jgi:penicillin amidase
MFAMAAKSILVCLWLSALAHAAPVEILRDPWGVPHVFAESDAGAFYGLGYATAEDRAFQMTYSLRIIQGRLAEVIGDVKKSARRETALENDKMMRTFGFWRAAKITAANLDAESKALLQAYCDGVNAYFHDHKDKLHPLFAQTGMTPEPWTPADCLASWWHLGQFFATDGTRELMVLRNSGREIKPPADITPMGPDDGPAVVKRSDVSKEWIERVEKYARERGASTGAPGPEGPKFSHAWVVGKKLTTTGSSVLVSDPQTPVRNPSLFYEFHIKGKTFNARGIGVAGSPIILIGFTDRVAWGATALGADQADLFMLKTDPARPDQYEFDGQWRAMNVIRETIKVKGGLDAKYVVRETHLGPVATAFCFATPADGEVAMKRIPMCEPDRDTIQGAIAMMRARDAREFDAALAAWRFPSANLIFGDAAGDVGYRAAGATPLRASTNKHQGRQATAGHSKEDDWREFVPHQLLPHVINPASGFVYSGNHRPIESWYPLPLGTSTGAGGDTTRSWRVRERLLAKEKFTPEDVLDIHFDSVNPARREIVRLGLHMRDVLKRELSDDAQMSLDVLAPWYRAGASSDLTNKGAELATELSIFFRMMSTELAFAYGGGETGLTYFLKSAAARIDKDAKADFSEREVTFIDQSLATAWRSAQQKYGHEPATWNAKARRAVTQQRLGYYESVDGFPALDHSMVIAMPALNVVDGGTITSRAAQSYTQWVPMHDPDSAQTILPIGQSERPDNPTRMSTMKLWEEGKLHAAPLSRAKVEALGTNATRLEYAN